MPIRQVHYSDRSLLYLHLPQVMLYFQFLTHNRITDVISDWTIPFPCASQSNTVLFLMYLITMALEALRNTNGKWSVTEKQFSTSFSPFRHGAFPTPTFSPLASTSNIGTWKYSHHMSEIFDLFLSKPVVGLTVHTVCSVWFLLRGVWFHILNALNRL